MGSAAVKAKPHTPSWQVLCVSWLLLSLLSGLWSLATPIAAAPDEPAHLIKAAAVVRGQFLVSPTGTVTVPQYIAFSAAQTCFAFHEDVTADCTEAVPDAPSKLVTATSSAERYNPVYYLLVGWPSLFVGDSSGIYWMRIVSGVLSSLFLAIAFTLVLPWRNPTLPVIALVTAATPMVLFLNGTVNPNSLEITATLAAFSAMLSVVRERSGKGLAVRASVVFVASAVASNMRGLSLLWLALALFTPLLLIDKRQFTALLKSRSVQLAAGGILFAALAAVTWMVTSSSLTSAIDAPGHLVDAPGVGTPGYLGFIWTLFSTFNYAQGMIGVFGWLDTPAPSFVFFVWSALAGGMIIIAVAVLRGRLLLFAAILAISTLVLPPVLQGIYITDGGVIWQGRYILPVFVCLMLGVGAVLADRIPLSPTAISRLVTTVLVLWAIAQFQSFATALRRYSVGLNQGWLDMLNSALWEPPGGVLLLLFGFGLVLTVFAVLMLLSLRRVTLAPPSPVLDTGAGGLTSPSTPNAPSQLREGTPTS